MKASSPQKYVELLNKSLEAFKFENNYLCICYVCEGDKEKGIKKINQKIKT